jgi:hypothetical protein
LQWPTAIRSVIGESIRIAAGHAGSDASARYREHKLLVQALLPADAISATRLQSAAQEDNAHYDEESTPGIEDEMKNV